MTTEGWESCTEATNVYELRRDGKLVHTGTEGEVWRYLHRASSSSVSWALKYEGYAIRCPDGSPYRYESH